MIDTLNDMSSDLKQTSKSLMVGRKKRWLKWRTNLELGVLNFESVRVDLGVGLHLDDAKDHHVLLVTLRPEQQQQQQ